MTAEQLKSLLIELCNNGIVRRYSGRGMFGEECVGIRYDSEAEALRELSDIREVLEVTGYERKADALKDAIRRCQTDDMGKGVIVYFPSLKF